MADPKIVCVGKVQHDGKYTCTPTPAGAISVVHDAGGTFSFVLKNPLNKPPIVVATSEGMAADGTQWASVFVRDITTKGFQVLGFLPRTSNLTDTGFSFMVVSID
jgi:hypothetical protein